MKTAVSFFEQNGGTYTRVDDVFLPDLKYYDDDLARKYSNAPDYFTHATAAIEKMFEMTGPFVLKDGLMSAVDIPQLETFEAGILFARAEGIIPAPESSHAIAAAIREAKKCRETGEEKVILFNLSGHGLIDMSAYDQYLSGDLRNYEITEEQVAENISKLEKII